MYVCMSGSRTSGVKPQPPRFDRANGGVSIRRNKVRGAGESCSLAEDGVDSSLCRSVALESLLGYRDTQCLSVLNTSDDP